MTLLARVWENNESTVPIHYILFRAEQLLSNNNNDSILLQLLLLMDRRKHHSEVACKITRKIRSLWKHWCCVCLFMHAPWTKMNSYKPVLAGTIYLFAPEPNPKAWTCTRLEPEKIPVDTCFIHSCFVKRPFWSSWQPSFISMTVHFVSQLCEDRGCHTSNSSLYSGSRYLRATVE